MEGRVNYLLVGIFTALFIAGLIIFAFWLMKYSNYEQPNHYVAYFNESVAGLNKDASVKYMGVDAGVVENISVHPTDTQFVAVYLKLNHNIKIKEDMRATLKFYGMTGLAYVEIFGKDSDSPLLVPKDGKIPIIQSVPSLFANLNDILANLTDKLSITLTKINQLMNDDNLQNVKYSLANIHAFTTELKTNKQDFTALVHNLTDSTAEMKKTFAKLNELTSHMDASFGHDLQKTIHEFQAASKEIKQLTHKLNHSLKEGDFNLKTISDPLIQKLSVMIANINRLSATMQETVEQIQESPSDLLFKSHTIKPGPGEKK